METVSFPYESFPLSFNFPGRTENKTEKPPSGAGAGILETGRPDISFLGVSGEWPGVFKPLSSQQASGASCSQPYSATALDPSGQRDPTFGGLWFTTDFEGRLRDGLGTGDAGRTVSSPDPSRLHTDKPARGCWLASPGLGKSREEETGCLEEDLGGVSCAWKRPTRFTQE